MISYSLIFTVYRAPAVHLYSLSSFNNFIILSACLRNKKDATYTLWIPWRMPLSRNQSLKSHRSRCQSDVSDLTSASQDRISALVSRKHSSKQRNRTLSADDFLTEKPKKRLSISPSRAGNFIRNSFKRDRSKERSSSEQRGKGREHASNGSQRLSKEIDASNSSLPTQQIVPDIVITGCCEPNKK